METVFVQNCWYVATWTHELTALPQHVALANIPVALYRKADGAPVALEDRCPHRTAPLSKGRIEDGDNVRCMYHGFKFGPDGHCLEIPGESHIPKAMKVRSFPVVDRHGWVWVWLGDPDRADEALIPPAVGVDHPDFIMKPGTLDYDAYYELINDNLTDFSHLSYVHANSFGAAEAWAANRPHIEPLPRGVRITRWLTMDAAMSGDGPEALSGGGDNLESTALYETYDFLAPGVILIYSAYFPASQMPQDGISAPTAEPMSVQFSSQAVTPMTDKKTRYFFAWGPRKTDEGAEELADQLSDLARMAFAEDRDIIEAQQNILDFGEVPQLLMAVDKAPVMMRRVIRELATAN